MKYSIIREDINHNHSPSKQQRRNMLGKMFFCIAFSLFTTGVLFHTPSAVAMTKGEEAVQAAQKYRKSHYEDESYKSLWSNADEYLATLHQATENGLLDLALLQITLYENSLLEGLKVAFTKKVCPRQALDFVAIQWDQITQSVGIERQRKFYHEWKNLPLELEEAYGHQKGDIALRKASKAIERILYEYGGSIYRCGGEEFFFYVPENSNHSIDDISQECCDSVRKLNLKHATSETADVLTVSIGVKRHKVAGRTGVEESVQEADKLLYEVKQSCRNNYKCKQ